MDQPNPPRWRAQMEPLQPDEEAPLYGRDELDHAHAPYVIARALKQLDLSDWLPKLMEWLGHYDGLEAHVEDGNDAAISVRDVLLAFVSKQAGKKLVGVAPNELGADRAHKIALKKQVVDAFLKQDFVWYCAVWDTDMRPRWNPLKQSWMSFCALGGQGVTMGVWLRPLDVTPEEQGLDKVEAYLLDNDGDDHGNEDDSANARGEAP
ncbi:hypothetical protein NU688_32795 [Variovorax sp. ZS18.2.2]|uniref:hypothetical protein n=1 Tax=Variovorax sp. ZS18.2.2 TaxID=2971255 RepID=UPI002151A803|nr:hypothetical protein [Variovorax sp. ZS18.2.2]MCR6480975.1 hypothetical protein [Variovorax sp. ZS18.2.2]